MKPLLTLTACLLALSCLLAGCSPTSTDSTESGQSPAQATPAEKITYTVKVVDQNGSPVAGASVQMCTDESCLMPAVTDENGTAVFTLSPADYHVTIPSAPEGYTADASQEYRFEGDSIALTVTITKD